MKNLKKQYIDFFISGNVRAIIKWLRVLVIVAGIGSASFAQQKTLVISGSTPKLFIVHKITSKENFYSIARMYNVPPKDIAAYNNLQFEKGLSVGGFIKIPLSENNFSQSAPAGSGEVLIPVYHTVQSKEGLYRVSLNYNKVPIAALKKWNHIQSDAVSVGTPLIVGYLKVVKNESPLAAKGVKVDMATAGAEKPATTPQLPTSDERTGQAPPVKGPDTIKEDKNDVHESDEHKVTASGANSKSSINFSGGYFKKLFDDQAGKGVPVNETASAGIFKSTSGWQDGKYYCFNNDAPPGTVIRVTDNLTGKSVYAKVLDAIPDIKQNADLTVILSNAAAEELGATEGKFDCMLSYVK